MRFCPVCQTRYDEDIIKFCTKDGTPLVEDNPTFTAMPSQASIGDLDEETVIRRNSPNNSESFSEPEKTSQRVVIPTIEEKKPVVRPLENPQHQQQKPRKSNTGLIVAVTILGTLVVLGGAGVVWWLLSGDDNANKNVNSNVNIANHSNLNDNGSTANFNNNVNTNNNANANTNSNANLNTNTKTPAPTKTPTPTPSPTPNTNSNVNANTNGNSVNPNVNTNSNRPVNAAPSPTPRVSPSPANNQNVNVGIINSRATSLPKPAYPPIARQQNVSGQVSVSVVVDENGNVLSAKAVAGHPLLRSAAESAARQSRFNPVKIGNQNVRASGTIVYSFINN